jgi:hypothetical protein
LSPCPQCGAETERGQLVCTSCGGRLALGRRRSDGALAALIVAAAVVVVVLGAGAAGFAVSELTSDSDGNGETSFAEQQAPAPPSAGAGEPQRATRAEDPASGEAPAGEPQAPGAEPPAEGPAPGEPGPARSGGAEAPTAAEEPRRGLLLDWPDDLTAHTVVLVTTGDRAAALRLARQAAKTGLEVGLLRADDYNLGTNLWIVFAGRFDTREGAETQATGLANRFPGAYPQLVEPAG